MAVRSCRVTFKDLEGVKHTVEVTAETLYEAVALGLLAVRGNDCVMGIAQGLNAVQVSVVDIPIEHSVKIQDFNARLERTAGSLKEISTRSRIKDILGLPKIRSQSKNAPWKIRSKPPIRGHTIRAGASRENATDGGRWKPNHPV